MQEKGIIIKDKGTTVDVLIERHSACSKCELNCGLSSMEAEKEETIVEIKKSSSQQTLQQGQQVILEIKEKNLVLSALFVYLFPLLSLIAGYFIFYSFSDNELIGITGSILALAFSFLLIRKVNVNLSANNKFEPEIIEAIPLNKGVENNDR